MSGDSAHIVIEHILGTLFTAEQRRLDQTVVELNERHNELTRRQDDGFLINGIFCRPKNPGDPGKPMQLAGPLQDEGVAYLRDIDNLKRERQQIKQSLVALLMPCKTLQNIRDALPNCLRDTLPPEVAQLSRIDASAWSIEDNPRAMRQYLKVLPRIEFYSASRLLY